MESWASSARVLKGRGFVGTGRRDINQTENCG